jgi:phospho-N-acetylmuramoyl-pentapeptide-transferase
MSANLFTTFISFIFHFLLIVPFINFLYRLKLQRAKQLTKDAFDKPTPIFDALHKHKSGTPVGGGILIVAVTSLLYVFFLFISILFNTNFHSNYEPAIGEIKVLLFAFVSFAFLGIYDDLSKIFFWKKSQFFGMRLRHKLLIEVVLAFIISFWLFHDLKIDIINIPFFGVYHLSFFYMLFSTFVIVAFSNAVNITDGLDGLATGILMIAVACFWVISSTIIDVPTSLFIAVWLGGLVAFLYFNIYPSRIFLGDAGALSFGATFAVIGLILGKTFALPIIGGIFVLEVSSSFFQLMSKRFFKKKLFPVAPLHLYLQMKGWEEPKVVMRMWIFGILFAFFGLMIAFMK